MRFKRIQPRLSTLTAFAVVVVVPLAVLALVRVGSDDSLAGVTVNAEPVFTSVTPREITDAKPAKLTLAWAKGDELVAPAWSGIVTNVAASVGTLLKPGDPIATISGVERIGFASDRPFYRPISSGDSGPDVEALHALLQKTGFLQTAPTDATTATFATTSAVRKLATSLGVQPTTGTFDPGWVVWLPADPFPLGSLELQVGRPAPPPGTVIGSARSMLTGATLASFTQEPLTLDPAVAWVAVVDGKSFEVDPIAAAVAPGALSALGEAVKQGAETASAIVQRSQPLHALAVPSTAVQVNEAGTLCVWIADGKSYRASTVKAPSARAGVTNITEGLTADARVLANPAAVVEHPACP